MIKSFLNTTAVATMLVAGVSTSAISGGVDPVIVVPAPTMPMPAPTANRAFPSIFGAASAIPAPGGSGYAALTIASPRGGVPGADADGDLSLGYTIGNPIDSVSLTFGVNLNSLTDSFGDSGNFNLSVARAINIGSNSATFVGASAGKVGAWGDDAGDEEALAGYVSHLMGVGASDTPVQFTVGYGNQTTLSDDGLGTIDEGFFYGVGVGVTETISLSLSGTETQVNLGGTVTIPAVSGLSMTAGVYDATDNASRQQYSLTVGYSF